MRRKKFANSSSDQADYNCAYHIEDQNSGDRGLQGLCGITDGPRFPKISRSINFLSRIPKVYSSWIGLELVAPPELDVPRQVLDVSLCELVRSLSVDSQA